MENPTFFTERRDKICPLTPFPRPFDKIKQFCRNNPSIKPINQNYQLMPIYLRKLTMKFRPPLTTFLTNLY